MSLPSIRGHHEVRRRLARAAAAGTLAQSILLQGPRGVGKERLGLWLAQLLVCDSPAGDEPCGACQPCRLVLRLEHPDVHWFFPLPRPDGASADKLREKLEDARAAELQLRRENPAHRPSFEKAPAIFLAAVQRIHQLAGVKPSMGRRKVFVVGDAELMVPQESSPEAANAFLKLLEEPPADTTVVVTSSQPGALLPTILSRVLSIRVPPLEQAAVEDFLSGVLELDPPDAERIARQAQGSIGAAVRLAQEAGGDGGPRGVARKLLIAALSPSPVSRLAEAAGQQPWGGRGTFHEELEALADWLRDLAAVACGAEDAVPDPEARKLLRRAVERRGVSAAAAAAALDRVTYAQFLAQGNVNPQLILADLLRRLQEELVPENAAAGATG